MKRGKTAAFLLCVLVTAMLTSCAAPSKSEADGDIPNGAREIVDLYLDKSREGPEAVIGYMYFADPQHEGAYMDSNWKGLYKYSVTSAEKINDKLFAFTINGCLRETPDVFDDYYYFAAEIDGEYKFILGVYSIPEELTENLDYDKYDYDDPNILG